MQSLIAEDTLRYLVPYTTADWVSLQVYCKNYKKIHVKSKSNEHSNAMNYDTSRPRTHLLDTQ